MPLPRFPVHVVERANDASRGSWIHRRTPRGGAWPGAKLAAVVQTLTVQDAVELAVVERNGFIESRHVGAAVVLSPEGEVVDPHGNPTR